MAKVAKTIIICGMIVSFGFIAEASELSHRERFELFNQCLPMDLVIEEVGEDARDIGLTRQSIY